MSDTEEPTHDESIIVNPRRTQSESEVDNYFAAAHHAQFGFGYGFNSPPLVGMASGHTTPTGRSPQGGGKVHDKGDVLTPRPGTPLGPGGMEVGIETSLTAAVAMALRTTARPILR